MSPNTTIGLGHALTQALFATVPKHIPDMANGGLTKTEQVIYRSPNVPMPAEQWAGFQAIFPALADEPAPCTLKINWWHGPDLRPAHNHPWPFRSYVIAGGFVEERSAVLRTDAYTRTTTAAFERKAGEVYECPYGEYHQILSAEPGTVTFMMIGPLVDNAWGYLGADGEHVPAVNDPNFKARVSADNGGL